MIRQFNYFIRQPRRKMIGTGLNFLLICLSLPVALGYDREGDRSPSEFLLGEGQRSVKEEVDIPLMRDGCELILKITVTPNTPILVDPSLKHEKLLMGKIIFEVEHPNFNDKFQMILMLLHLQRTGFIWKERTICCSSCKNISSNPFALAAFYNRAEVVNIKIEVREGRHDCEVENIGSLSEATSGIVIRVVLSVSVLLNLMFFVSYLLKQYRSILVALGLYHLLRQYRKVKKTSNTLSPEDTVDVNGGDVKNYQAFTNKSEKVYNVANEIEESEALFI